MAIQAQISLVNNKIQCGILYWVVELMYCQKHFTENYRNGNILLTTETHLLWFWFVRFRKSNSITNGKKKLIEIRWNFPFDIWNAQQFFADYLTQFYLYIERSCGKSSKTFINHSIFVYITQKPCRLIGA